jgi:orotate phosphoribosyltransferase-like protein
VPRTNVGVAAKSSVRRIRTTEKTLKALELRKRGMNYTQIGEKLGCARSTACRYVLSELENLADKCREEAVQVRDLELQRLDELYLIAYHAISDGNDLAGD